LYNIEFVIVHCRVFTWNVHAFIVIPSLWWRTLSVRNDIGYGEERNWKCLLRWQIQTVKLSPESTWYHMHLDESGTLHALDNWWVVSYLTMWIDDYVHWWNFADVVNIWKRWICIHCLIILVSLMNNVDVELHCEWSN